MKDNKELLHAQPSQASRLRRHVPEKQRAIASKGGRSIPAHKRSFSVNRALAVTAGRKGGRANGAAE